MDSNNSGYQHSPKQRQRFWFCYVDGKGTPSHKHYLLADAKQEAERLARQENRDVFLLRTSGVVRYVPPTPPSDIEWQLTVDWRQYDNLPRQSKRINF